MARSRPQKSVDGVIQRQRKGRIGDFSKADKIEFPKTRHRKHSEDLALKNKEADMMDSESIEEVFEPEEAMNNPEAELTRRKRRKEKRKQKKEKKKAKRATESKKRKYFRRGIKFTALFTVLLIGFLIAKGIIAINSIIDLDGDGAVALGDNIDPLTLNGEGDGRVNIMLLGIGGPGHEGGNLADTIMIVSIDPFAKEMALLSIPRDLYLDIPGYGSSRINAAHAFGEDYEGKNKGIGLTKRTVEQALDIPIHYYIRTDFKGFEKAVDAVGGIDINVTNPVVNDYKFAWMLNGQPFNVPKGMQHFDGFTALLYARSRYTSAGGDFDRNSRQREVLVALKDKVLTLGTFADPRKVNDLIGSAGNHVRTNLSVDEMLRVYDIVAEIPSDKIISAGLDNSENNYLMGANIGGASVLVPKSGTFTEIQEYVRSLFIDGFIRKENAWIDVLNGSEEIGAATLESDKLKTYNYIIKKVGDVPKNQIFDNTFIVDLSNGEKPYTKQYLEKRYNLTMVGPDQLPKKVKTNASFVIILGTNGRSE